MNPVEHPHGGGNHQHVSHSRVKLHQAPRSDETQRETSSLVQASGMTADVEMASSVSETLSSSLHVKESKRKSNTTLGGLKQSFPRRSTDQGLGRRGFRSCYLFKLVQPQHRERNPASLTRQTVQSTME